MSLKDVDLEHALRRLAERRIEEAMREGKFSNLPGAGKPIELEPMPADENARLMWWALRIMKQNDFTPEEVRWRKRIDNLRDELAKSTSEKRVETLVGVINGLVRQLNTLGTNAIKLAVAPLSLEIELRRLRERLAAPAPIPPVAPPVGRRATRAPVPVECHNPACKCRNP